MTSSGEDAQAGSHRPWKRPSSILSWLVKTLIDVCVNSSLCSDSIVVTMRTVSPAGKKSPAII
jgi:hypothetical protein